MSNTRHSVLWVYRKPTPRVKVESDNGNDFQSEVKKQVDSELPALS
jgi:hypothetical protein